MSEGNTAIEPVSTAEDWSSPLEQALREGVQSYLKELLELEVTRALGRLRYGRQDGAQGHRNGHRSRELVSALGRMQVAEPIVRLLLDGTVVKVRLDRKATNLPVLVALGVRADGQKVVLAMRAMGGESEAAWRALLDDLIARGLCMPKLVIVDGGKGLEAALSAVWPTLPVQRCTVHKHHNLLAHAPKRLHEEISADYTDLIYATTAAEVQVKRKAFVRKWRLKCRAVADSFEEAGDKLFTFLRYPACQWRSIRTTNAIERLNEEFRRRIKIQCMLPCAESVCMLFWALLASGQITLRKVDGWQTLNKPPLELDQAA